MMFSVYRPQYFISHTKSHRLLATLHRLSCEKVLNLHKTLVTWAWDACVPTSHNNSDAYISTLGLPVCQHAEQILTLVPGKSPVTWKRTTTSNETIAWSRRSDSGVWLKVRERKKKKKKRVGSFALAPYPLPSLFFLFTSFRFAPSPNDSHFFLVPP